MRKEKLEIQKNYERVQYKIGRKQPACLIWTKGNIFLFFSCIVPGGLTCESWFVIVFFSPYMVRTIAFLGCALAMLFRLSLFVECSVHVDLCRTRSRVDCSTSRGWRFCRCISSMSRQSTSTSSTRHSPQDWTTAIRSYCEPTV